MFRRAP